jgi:hypothetical protein
MERLLASMDAGRLVVLCGAGLSMAPPSSLPSAKRVAEQCFDEYRSRINPGIDPALRQNLEALAEYFVGLNTLKSHFIESVVPWTEFMRPPNPGHAAIADFLITGAAAAGLSSNYDTLIEACARQYGADFRGALDGDQATARAPKQSPLLKFHGCENLDRQNTVWAPSQLADPVVRERIERSKVWMAAHLRQKDFLVVGFWSDWSYLNSIFQDSLQGLDPVSVTVIDLSGADALESKAPDLWEIAHQPNVTFAHVQESGADALDELRRAFSENYRRQVLSAGRAAFESATGVQCDPAWLERTNLSSDSLYGWRRDAEGVPTGKPAQAKRPTAGEQLGCFHLLLKHAGAVQTDQGYSLTGRTIRVVNGSDDFLSTVQTRFTEAPSLLAAEIVVAVGAIDYSLPADVVRPGTPGSVMRPAASGRWLTFEGAIKELAL